MVAPVARNHGSGQGLLYIIVVLQSLRCNSVGRAQQPTLVPCDLFLCWGRELLGPLVASL